MTIEQAASDFAQTMHEKCINGFVTTGIGENDCIIAYFEPDKMPNEKYWFMYTFKVIPLPMSRPEPA
jgi:hypothetical protein